MSGRSPKKTLEKGNHINFLTGVQGRAYSRSYFFSTRTCVPSHDFTEITYLQNSFWWKHIFLMVFGLPGYLHTYDSLYHCISLGYKTYSFAGSFSTSLILFLNPLVTYNFRSIVITKMCFLKPGGIYIYSSFAPYYCSELFQYFQLLESRMPSIRTRPQGSFSTSLTLR